MELNGAYPLTRTASTSALSAPPHPPAQMASTAAAWLLLLLALGATTTEAASHEGCATNYFTCDSVHREVPLYTFRVPVRAPANLALAREERARPPRGVMPPPHPPLCRTRATTVPNIQTSLIAGLLSAARCLVATATPSARTASPTPSRTSWP